MNRLLQLFLSHCFDVVLLDQVLYWTLIKQGSRLNHLVLKLQNCPLSLRRPQLIFSNLVLSLIIYLFDINRHQIT